MSIVADNFTYVIGVDTHACEHHYSIIDTKGVILDEQPFPTTTAGLQRAVAWIGRRTNKDITATLISVEGTGCYGRTLTELLLAYGYQVIEAPTPTRGANTAKTDALDARRAATTVLFHDLTTLRHVRAGTTGQELQILVSAREHMTRDATASKNALTSLCRSHNLGIDARTALTTQQTKTIALWKTRTSDTPVQARARTEAIRLARHIRDITQQLTTNNQDITTLVTSFAPDLITEHGIGPVSAATIIAAWSYHGRITSEAAFAMLAGTAPIPASSGNTHRHRLNRGGDRRLNKALHTIAIVRMRSDTRTQKYVDAKTAQGRSKKDTIRQLKRYIARRIYRILENLPQPT